MKPTVKRLLALGPIALFCMGLALPASAIVPSVPTLPGSEIHFSSSVSVHVGTSDSAIDVTVDNAGNIYVTGHVREAVGNDNVWIGKYDSSFVFLASMTFSVGSFNEKGNGIALDAGGNIFVAGTINQNGGGDIWIGKYDSDLVFITSAAVNGSAGGFDRGEDIAVDASGNIWVTGELKEIGENSNIWVAKYDADLVLISSAVYNDPSNQNDIPGSLALDDSGNVFIAGESRVAGNVDIWVGKFDSSLVFLASASFDGAGSGIDHGSGIALGGDGEIFVTGYVRDIGDNDNAVIVKFDSSFVMLSSVTIDGGTNDGDWISNIAVAGSDIFVVGGIIPGANSDFYVANHDSATLVLVSSISINGNADDWDSGLGIAIDRAGSVLMVGIIAETVGSDNAFIARFIFKDPTAVTASAGAALTHNMPGGEASVTIPQGAFSSDVTITLQGPATLAADTLGNIPMTGTGVALEVVVTPALQPTTFITMKIPYRDSDVVGLEENNLLLARFDVAGNVWVPLYSTPDVDNNTVTALTDHFSKFQIMLVTPAETVSNVRTFPNPFRPYQGHTTVTFLNLPALARIRIFTMAGEKVRDMTANGAGVATWDGRNQFGTFVAPGVYYGYAQSGKSLRRTFKIAVER